MEREASVRTNDGDQYMCVEFSCPEALPPWFSVPFLEGRRRRIPGRTHSMKESSRLQGTNIQHPAAPRGVLVRGLDDVYHVL